MTAELSTQLERYVAAVTADQGEISVAEVHRLLPAIRELPTPTSNDRRRVGRSVGVVAAVAAAVVLLLLVGGVALLTRSGDPVEPATPTTMPAPVELLNQSQVENLAGFLGAFQRRGFVRRGGAEKLEGGAFEGAVIIDSPTLGGPITKTFLVPGETGQEPDEPVGPDSLVEGTLAGSAVRAVAEERLAALYVWALETYPDETAARCGVGFEGSGTTVAWPPGYSVDSTCGGHLAGLLTEFNPAEAPQPLAQPDPGAGLWSSVDPTTPEGSPGLEAFFDVADTPVGLLAAGLDGLWISQDAVEWQPYARDSVVIEGGLSRIAVSDVGIVVADPTPDEAATWFSPDGVRWTPVAGLRLAVSDSRPLTASAERFVAIDDRHQVVSSTDGATWQPVEAPPASRFHLVAATPIGFYAAHDHRLWTSPDGVVWEELPAAIDGRVNDMAGLQTGLVAVTTDGRIWHSGDGTTWTEVHALPPGDHRCTRVGASGVGFLVVALLDDPFDVESGITTAWFSEDGRRWARVPAGQGDDAPEPSPICQSEVIPYGDGFLSVAFWGPPNRMFWRYVR